MKDWRRHRLLQCTTTIKRSFTGRHSSGHSIRPSRITMKAVSPTADFSFDYQDLDFRPVASATR